MTGSGTGGWPHSSVRDNPYPTTGAACARTIRTCPPAPGRSGEARIGPRPPQRPVRSRALSPGAGPGAAGPPPPSAPSRTPRAEGSRRDGAGPGHPGPCWPVAGVSAQAVRQPPPGAVRAPSARARCHLIPATTKRCRWRRQPGRPPPVPPPPGRTVSRPSAQWPLAGTPLGAEVNRRRRSPCIPRLGSCSDQLVPHAPSGWARY